MAEQAGISHGSF